MAGKGN